MKWFIGLAILGQAFFFSDSFADVNPTVQSVPIERAFFIQGFDDTDVAQVVIKGVFPSTCYQMGPTDLWVNHRENRIEIKQLAYLYDGNCLRVAVPYHQTIEVGVLPASSYQVVDTKEERTLGKLSIARTPEGGVGTDDYLYAPLQDAYISGLKRKPYLTLRGTFANNCIQFKDIKVGYKNDVLIVQPIVEKKNGNYCKDGSFPFTKRLRLKQNFKREFLLHARSMNGQAINKVYTP
ncbi:MAG: hypothetical protein KDD51_16415 [Bdellovibrionales bacterium]|nr:hypothetical protein [Bdellovibrionales bacterium]MCB0418398.1 hypothetical protein [Bdellovibrionales bacterium]